MNPAHAIDVYVDLAIGDASVVRRRDSQWWHGSAEAYLLGTAVIEALDPKRPKHLEWQADSREWEFESEDQQFVVVWRQDHQTLVGIPVYPGGKASNTVLSESPRCEELGQAILTKARFSAEAKGRCSPLE